MRLRSNGIAITLVLALTLGCGKMASAPRSANEYVWLTRYDVKTLDPAAVQDWTTGKVLSYIYPSIGLVCQLGCDKPSVYSVDIKGAKFSNGDPVTAEDIRFTLERCILPESQSSVGNQFAMEIRGSDDFLKGKTSQVEGIKINSPTSLSIILQQVDVSYAEKLKNTAFGVLNHKLLDLHKPVIDAKPGYGAGNWTMGSVAPGREWKLQNRTTKENLRFRFIGDSATRRSLFDKGDADYAMFAAHEAGVVNNHPSLDKGGPTTLVYLQFNPKTKPELTSQLRYSIGARIRTNANFSMLLNKMVTPAASFLELSSIQPMPSVVVSPPKINSKANLEITYAEIGMQNPSVEAMVTTLRQAGLDIRGRALPSGAMLEKNSRGEVPILFTGWQPDFGGPLNSIPMLFHSKSSENHSGYNNPKVDALIDKAQRGENAEVNMQRANQFIESEAPCIPLYVQRDLVLKRKEPPVP